MTDVPSKEYAHAFLVQYTLSKDLLATVIIYRATDAKVSVGPGKVIEAKHIELIFKDRIVSEAFKRASPQQQHVISRDMAKLSGGYAMATNQKELRDILEELFRGQGLTQAQAEYQALSWLGSMKPHLN